MQCNNACCSCCPISFKKKKMRMHVMPPFHTPLRYNHHHHHKHPPHKKNQVWGNTGIIFANGEEQATNRRLSNPAFFRGDILERTHTIVLDLSEYVRGGTGGGGIWVGGCVCGCVCGRNVRMVFIFTLAPTPYFK